MVGSAIGRQIRKQWKEVTIITADHKTLDLTEKSRTSQFINDNPADMIIVAAAKVGGIKFNNDYPVEFLNDNIQIAMNVLNGAHISGCQKLLYLGSSCIYPKNTAQPIREEQLFSGPLEKTNEAYSIAKIAGVKLCEFYNRQYDTDFRALMPCNLYGVGDRYDKQNSHVIPALILKMHSAKQANELEINLWGDGTPLREFLYVDDLASACLTALGVSKNTWQSTCPNSTSFLNAGSGNNISIKQLAEVIADVVGFKGKILFSSDSLNGVTSKLLDSARMNGLGWKPTTELKQGITSAYNDFLVRELEPSK